MKIIESIEEMKEYSRQLKSKGNIIASVDTDAELHDGHMSLVKIAKEKGDVVNLMAGHSVAYELKSTEEYEKYVKEYRQKPDGLPRDIEMAKSHGVDVFFYPSMSKLYIDELSIPREMCEKVYNFMKTHETFRKEAMELQIWILSTYFPVFKCVTPDIHVVGQKDAYQAYAVKYLIKQLNLPIKIIAAPILRDSDGLALNSRNTLLTSSELQRAASIYQVLQEIASLKEIEPISYFKSYIMHHVKADICMVDVVCTETLKDLVVFDRKMLVVINAFFRDVYLSDNIIIEP